MSVDIPPLRTRRSSTLGLFTISSLILFFSILQILPYLPSIKEIEILNDSKNELVKLDNSNTNNKRVSLNEKEFSRKNAKSTLELETSQNICKVAFTGITPTEHELKVISTRMITYLFFYVKSFSWRLDYVIKSNSHLTYAFFF